MRRQRAERAPQPTRGWVRRPDRRSAAASLATLVLGRLLWLLRWLRRLLCGLSILDGLLRLLRRLRLRRLNRLGGLLRLRRLNRLGWLLWRGWRCPLL